MANITGTSSYDSLTGTSEADHIVGLGQGDGLYGLGGDDWLEGGDGDDWFEDGAGDDLAEGGEGDDRFTNTDGSDTLHGGAGNDRFTATRGSGQSGIVTMTGGTGRDEFDIRSIGSTSFIVDSGEGDDLITIDTYRGDHVLTLGSGVDTVALASPLYFADFLTTTITDFTAGADGDRLDLSAFFNLHLASWDGNQNPFALGYIRLVQSGADVLVEIDQTGGGNSYVEFLRLADVSAESLTFHNLDGFPSDGSIPSGLILDGTAGPDRFVGAAGDDTISGFEESDALYGGAGADTIRGGDGRDELFGEGGNDLLEGGAGSDRLTDGRGDDIVRGGADSDTFYSQDRGNDLLEGEGGNDYFDVRRGLDNRVTVDGGDGDDYIVLAAYSAANLFTVIGGAGSETINFFAMSGTAQISLGAGADLVSLAWLDLSLLNSGHLVISDFETGAGGDRLDFDSWLAANFTWDQVANPFQTGHLRLVQSGSDTLLQADRNGGADNLRTIVTFTGRQVADFAPFNLDGFASDGSAPTGLTLIGTAASERLTGSAAADRIEGKGGRDTLEGLGGADVIIGGDQDDTIEGGTGDDRLEGGGGNDYIYGGAGADDVDGGEGQDVVYVNGGGDTIRGGGGDDTVFVQASPPAGGTIAVHGEGGADILHFYDSAPGTFVIGDGGAGSDTFRIGNLHGSGTMTLGAGSDRVVLTGNAGGNGAPGDVRITDFETGAGGDLIDLAGSLGFLLLAWDGSNPFVTGHVRLIQQGEDTLLRIDRDGGGSSHGFVTTLTLSNVAATSLTAANLGFRQPLLVGSGGYSTLQEAIDAAQDGDTILIAAGTYSGDVNVDKDVTLLGPNRGVDGTGERGAEAVIDGMVTISAAGVTIDGVKFVGRGVSPLGGHDALAVLANDFTVTNSVFDAMVPANGAVHVRYMVAGVEISDNFVRGYFNGIMVQWGVTGSVDGNYFQENAEAIIPSTGLQSSSALVMVSDNVFDGFGRAALALTPFGPDPVDIAAYVTGNSFTNTDVAHPVLILPTRDSPNIVGTDHDEKFDALGAVSGYADPETVFSFDGRGGDDHVSGADRGDSLVGGAGDDELFGNGGNDLLDGGTGLDEMTGGTGDDSYVVDSAGDLVIENAGEGTDEVRTALAGYSLAGLPDVENLTALSNVAHDFSGNDSNNVIAGASGDDLLNGAGGNDMLDGGIGLDRMTGGTGDDAYVVDVSGDLVVENAGEGTDEIRTGLAAYNLAGFPNIENLRAISNVAHDFRGNGSNNLIVGGAGNDSLNGRGGADRTEGGLGNDVHHVDNAGDVVVELADQGSDTVATSISYTLAANVENLQAANIGGTDPLALNGNGLNNFIWGTQGNNIIDGRGGADFMLGYAGNDMYIVDNAGDIAYELEGGGADTVATSISYTLAAHIENLQALDIAGTAALALTGNAQNNFIWGTQGNNVIDGAGGADFMLGYAGDDIYHVDNAGDIAYELEGGGIDTVVASISHTLSGNVENLQALNIGGSDPLSLTGNDLRNFIWGTQGNNVLDGGAGADVMIGYGGNDVYFVDNAGDVTYEEVGGGSDTVAALASYALGANIENLQAANIGGNAALSLTGNDQNNFIWGTQGSNVLSGRGGNDRIFGFAGADQFLFDTAAGAANADWLDDFQAGTDKILLDNSVFTALTDGALSSNAFVTGTSALDVDDRIIFDAASGSVFYDADGNGAGQALLIAYVPVGQALTAADILVV